MFGTESFQWVPSFVEGAAFELEMGKGGQGPEGFEVVAAQAHLFKKVVDVRALVVFNDDTGS